MDFKGIFKRNTVDSEYKKEEIANCIDILKKQYAEEKENQIKTPVQEEKDNEINYQIYLLKRKLSYFNPLTTSAEERKICSIAEEKEKMLCDIGFNALELEKANLEKGIENYEKIISEGYYYTVIPYERLAINYRKQKRYEEEVAVLKLGIITLSSNKGLHSVDKLLDRLEKAIILKEKYKTI